LSEPTAAAMPPFEHCSECGSPLTLRAEVGAELCQRHLRRLAEEGVDAFAAAYAPEDPVAGLADLDLELLWRLLNDAAGMIESLQRVRRAAEAAIGARLRGNGAFRLGDQVLRASPARRRVVRKRASLLAFLRPQDLGRVFSLSAPRVKALRAICGELGLPARFAEDTYLGWEEKAPKVEVLPRGAVRMLDRLPEGVVVFDPTGRGKGPK
jgi:hypothetical protein